MCGSRREETLKVDTRQVVRKNRINQWKIDPGTMKTNTTEWILNLKAVSRIIEIKSVIRMCQCSSQLPHARERSVE